MTAATVSHRTLPAQSPPMSKALVASLGFHAALITFFMIGLPFLKSDPVEIIAAPMSVELVRADEAEAASEPVKPKPVPQKAEAKPHPQMPTVKAKTPPKPIAPEKPAPGEPVPVPEAPKAEKIPDKPAPKPVAPPKPEKRPLLTRPDPEASPEEQEDFQGLLRNLMEQEPVAAEKSVDKAVDKTAPSESPLAKFSQAMTGYEMSLFQQQLSQCWSILAGARHAESLRVDIRLTVNPDRTIRQAEIVDKLRYSTDSYYQAAADEALRAVRNPRCNPLELPPNKYEEWKTIIVTFDPSQLL